VTSGAWTSWTGEVIEDWIDYNQHMSEGFYGLVFGFATDEYLLRVGFDADYRAATKGSFYTVETHITFVDEIALGTLLSVRTNVVGVDAIRLHLFHELIRTVDDVVAATQESLLLHVDTAVDRVGPMTGAVLGAATTDADAHAHLVTPDQIGKVIRGPGIRD
jgi:acyl-CoA thioesterase FadM